MQVGCDRTLRTKLATLGVVLSLLAWAAPAMAQNPPDCTGISDISGFDGETVTNLDGLLTTVRVASGLVRPLFITAPRGDLERIFVLEQDGRIRIVKNGTLLGTPFLNITSVVRSPADGGNNEEGLLGMAFHPDYDQNGWFFVYHTRNDGQANEVWRYTVSGDPDLANASSAALVTSITHNFAGNHNGGMIDFSPLDGKLYIGTGDGGGGCDPGDTAQDLTDKLGKILRLGVDSLPASTAGNPFDGGATTLDDEVWSYGKRNPYRFSFDRETGAMYVGDVGQNQWEEINCELPGSAGGLNYGWPDWEGSFCPNPSCGSSSCVASVKPIQQYSHSLDGFSCSITGGHVYRGCRMGDLHGSYFLRRLLLEPDPQLRHQRGVQGLQRDRSHLGPHALGGRLHGVPDHLVR